MAAKKQKDEVARQWAALHGSNLPRAAANLAQDADDEQAAYRPVSFLDAGNVFEAAVLAAADSHRLTLWEPFLNVLPLRSLDDGDVLFLYVPPPTQKDVPPAIVLWNHDRDDFEAPRSADLDGLPPGDPTQPLRFAARSAYLVELFARGRFDLERFAAFAHAPLAVDQPAFADNVRSFTPTGVYSVWQAYFSGDEALLEKVLVFAEASASRYVRDAAALVRALQGGRDEVGPLRGVRALRAETARVLADPTVHERAVAAERRAATDRRLAGLRGPLTLPRWTGEAGEPIAGQRRARIGELELIAEDTKPRGVRLVLRRGERSRAMLPLSGFGPPELEPTFHVIQEHPVALVALWKRTVPGSPRFPNDGVLDLYTIAHDRFARVTAFELDVAHLETRDGRTLVRTPDGAAYALEGAPSLALPPVPVDAAPIPGAPAAPPPASCPPAIGDDRVELGPRSLKLWRGDTLLFEEPLTEAYEMAVVPKRRMVAILGASFELRPTLDVFWIRPLEAPVAAGQGGCSWVSWPIDGRALEIRSSEDTLFVGEAGRWIAVDSAPLTEVPSWIRARGWL